MDVVCCGRLDQAENVPETYFINTRYYYGMSEPNNAFSIVVDI